MAKSGVKSEKFKIMTGPGFIFPAKPQGPTGRTVTAEEAFRVGIDTAQTNRVSARPSGPYEGGPESAVHLVNNKKKFRV